MATVTVERDRAQLILIGALALAVTLVAIALVLNSAIFTHNLASRYQSPAESPATLDRDVRIGVGGTMDHANREYAEDGYSAITDNYTDGLSDLENGSARIVATNGRSVRIDHVSESEGVRVADENESSTFAPANGSAEKWRVATNVRVRKFETTVDRSALATHDASDVDSLLDESDLLSLGSSDQLFVVNVSNGSDAWRVGVYRDEVDTDRVNVTVRKVGASTSQTCTTTGSNATVEISSARFGGKPCEPLSFVDELSGPLNVTYHYGGEVSGTYELTTDGVVDGPGREVGPFTDAVDAVNFDYHCGDNGDPKQTYHSANSGNYPSVSPAIYEATVNTTFEGSDTSYKSQHQVAPAEPDPERVAPRVTAFTVVDSSDGTHANFTVDWSVSDPDGDLSAVHVTVDGTTDTTGISGETASGSVDQNVTSGWNDVYDINVTVQDATGNDRTVVQTHEADDDDTTGCPG